VFCSGPAVVSDLQGRNAGWEGASEMGSESMWVIWIWKMIGNVEKGTGLIPR
jgi:hypothetical protein